MARLFYHVMQDNLGNLLFDVSGTMRLAGTGTVATIYGDEALTVPLPNPMTNHPSFGSFKCYLGAGLYDFYMAKSGYSFETLTGVQGWGTMALQNASAVQITGGSLSNMDSVATQRLGVNNAIVNDRRIGVTFDRATESSLVIRPNADTGVGYAIMFQNAATVPVGAISTNATTTTYATTSDARWKHAIAPLTDALDVLRALNPVQFRWRVDDSPGHGLLAQEVAQVVPGVVSGDGASELPMGIDYSKLVVYLIGAVKELTMQVELLTARCDAAGA